MSDDDDDEVAITGDQEPEDTSAPTQVDEDDDDEFEAQGGFVSGEVVQRGREISPKTRELFKAAAKKIAEQKAADGDDEGDFGHYDELGEPPQSPAAAATDAPKAAHTPATAAPAPVAAAPAPSLDPQVLEAKRTFETKLADLDAREKAVQARERAGDLAQLGEVFTERPADAIVTLLKQWTGAATDAEIADEVADLIVELSGSVHKVPLQPEIKSRLDAKRALRAVKAAKATFAERDEATKQRQQAADDAALKARVVYRLGKDLAQPELQQQYPFLTAEENAAELVFDVVEAQHKKDGTVLTWQDAAKRANDYLQSQASEWFDKRKHLLAAGSNGNGKPNGRAPGDQQDHRRSSAPEKSATPPSPPHQPPPNGDQRWSNEEHRARTRAKMRAVFKRAAAEE